MSAYIRAVFLLAVSWSAGMVVRLLFDENGPVLLHLEEVRHYDYPEVQPHVTSPSTPSLPMHMRKAIRLFRSKESVSVHVNDTTAMKMNKRTALWVGSYPMKALNLEEKKRRRLSIVISHCNKPVNWIQEYIHDTITELDITLESVTIVSKCGKPVVGAMPGSTIVRLPNVGRCDHTYAQRIANMTEVWTSPSSQVQVQAQQQLHTGNNMTSTQRRALADDDDVLVDDDRNHIVLFIKDNDYRADTHHYRPFRHILEIVEGPSGFACVEPPLHLTGLSMSLYHNYKKLRSFGLKSYNGTQKQELHTSLDCNETEGNGRVIRNATIETCDNLPTYEFRSNYSSYGAWIDALDLERHLLHGRLSSASSTFDINNPAIAPVCYGGIFATTKYQILRAAGRTTVDDNGSWDGRSTVFHRLAESLSRQDNIEEGHFAERTWAALLSNPLNWKDILRELQPEILLNTFINNVTTSNQTALMMNLPSILMNHIDGGDHNVGGNVSLYGDNINNQQLLSWNETKYWNDIFAPYPLETRCQIRFVALCGVQIMKRKRFRKMSDGIKVNFLTNQ